MVDEGLLVLAQRCAFLRGKPRLDLFKGPLEAQCSRRRWSRISAITRQSTSLYAATSRIVSVSPSITPRRLASTAAFQAPAIAPAPSARPSPQSVAMSPFARIARAIDLRDDENAPRTTTGSLLPTSSRADHGSCGHP